MVTEYNDKNFIPTMNFFKNTKNWRNIFHRAATIVANEARDNAKRLAPRKTGD